MELVGAGPCLFPRVQEKQCSASWYSTALRINEVSRGNCVYSDSQDKCDKGLSMAVDEKACPLGKVDTTTSFIFWIVPRCVKIKCGHQLEDSKPGYCVKTTKTCPGGAGFSCVFLSILPCCGKADSDLSEVPITPDNKRATRYYSVNLVPQNRYQKIITELRRKVREMTVCGKVALPKAKQVSSSFPEVTQYLLEETRLSRFLAAVCKLLRSILLLRMVLPCKLLQEVENQVSTASKWAGLSFGNNQPVFGGGTYRNGGDFFSRIFARYE